jgi:hypothetical protein
MTTAIKEQKEFVIYQATNGSPKIEVRLEGETIWLTNLQLTELFQTTKSNVSEHIKHIFEDGELNEISVVRNFRTTTIDGKSKNRIPEISAKNAVGRGNGVFGNDKNN